MLTDSPHCRLDGTGATYHPWTTQGRYTRWRPSRRSSGNEAGSGAKAKNAWLMFRYNQICTVLSLPTMLLN